MIGIIQSITAPRRGQNEQAQRQGELVKCYCWGNHYPTIGVVNSGKWHSLKDEPQIRRQQRWEWPLIHGTTLCLSVCLAHSHKHTHTLSLPPPLVKKQENRERFVLPYDFFSVCIKYINKARIEHGCCHTKCCGQPAWKHCDRWTAFLVCTFCTSIAPSVKLNYSCIKPLNLNVVLLTSIAISLIKMAIIMMIHF